MCILNLHSSAEGLTRICHDRLDVSSKAFCGHFQLCVSKIKLIPICTKSLLPHDLPPSPRSCHLPDLTLLTPEGPSLFPSYSLTPDPISGCAETSEVSFASSWSAAFLLSPCPQYKPICLWVRNSNSRPWTSHTQAPSALVQSAHGTPWHTRLQLLFTIH